MMNGPSPSPKEIFSGIMRSSARLSARITGVAEWMRGNEAKAAGRFRRESARFPDSYGALPNLARLYLDARDIDSAFHYGERAIETKPYENSLALCPDFAAAKEKLALTLKLLENLPSHDRHR
jgi:hypothetical protein